MNNIIERISQIEAAAAKIRAGAEEQKKQSQLEMSQKQKDFDARVKQETADTIAKIQEQLTKSNEAELAEQQAKTRRIISDMQQEFDLHHTKIAQELFADMIRPEEELS